MAALISAICSVDGDIGTGGDRYSPPATLVWSPILTIAKVVGDRAEVGSMCNMRKSLQSSQLNKTPCISEQMTTVTTADCSPYQKWTSRWPMESRGADWSTMTRSNAYVERSFLVSLGHLHSLPLWDLGWHYRKSAWGYHYCLAVPPIW